LYCRVKNSLPLFFASARWRGGLLGVSSCFTMSFNLFRPTRARTPAASRACFVLPSPSSQESRIPKMVAQGAIVPLGLAAGSMLPGIIYFVPRSCRQGRCTGDLWPAQQACRIMRSTCPSREDVWTRPPTVGMLVVSQAVPRQFPASWVAATKKAPNPRIEDHVR
jgi:hypothetical protein